MCLAGGSENARRISGRLPGAPRGIRTPVLGLKGLRPSPLDDGGSDGILPLPQNQVKHISEVRMRRKGVPLNSKDTLNIWNLPLAYLHQAIYSATARPENHIPACHTYHIPMREIQVLLSDHPQPANSTEYILSA